MVLYSDSPNDRVDITIFVACYNEVDNIIDTLTTIISAMNELIYSYEILVIDDASTDGSVENVTKWISNHPGSPVRLYVRSVNQGLAQNFIEAAFLGQGEFYRLICGDNVESKDNIKAIFSHVGRADMIIPYHVQSTGKSRFRMGLSGTYTALVNCLSGHNLKYYNGCTVHRRSDVLRWHTDYHGFGFQADLITRLLDRGATYIEVPSSTTERLSGKSHALTRKNFFSVLHTLLDIAIRRTARLCAGGKKRFELGVIKRVE